MKKTVEVKKSPFYFYKYHEATSGLVELFSTENSVVCTKTDYFHYDSCNETDQGWGCAYRVLQSILSNLYYKQKKETKNTGHIIPSIYEIQLQLEKIKLFKKKDVGSNKWIEPPEIALYLQSLSINCDEAVFYNPLNKQELKKESTKIYHNFEELITKFYSHFEKNKTPIIFDDSIYAYSLVGIRRNKDEFQVLRFDPHNFDHENFESYKKSVESKQRSIGGVKWIKIEQCFSSSRWMLAFPQIQ
eukprot:gene8656-603_t